MGKGKRRDRGSQPSLAVEPRELLRRQYEEHPGWTVKLHYDNLPARIAAAPALGALHVPSYHSVRRFLKAEGPVRQRRARRREGPTGRAEGRHGSGDFEVRSYEVAHTHSLRHADFHPGSRA